MKSAPYALAGALLVTVVALAVLLAMAPGRVLLLLGDVSGLTAN